MHRGAVTDWEALESIWHYTVFEQLGWIEGEEGGLMITAPLVWSRRDREVAAQVAAWLNQAYHAQLMQYGERAEYLICHLRMTVE